MKKSAEFEGLKRALLEALKISQGQKEASRVSIRDTELEMIQAAEAARRLEDIRSGKTQMVIGNAWRASKQKTEC